MQKGSELTLDIRNVLMQPEVDSGNVNFMLSKHFNIQSSSECILQTLHHDVMKKKGDLLHLKPPKPPPAVSMNQCQHIYVISQLSWQTRTDYVCRSVFHDWKLI